MVTRFCEQDFELDSPELGRLVESTDLLGDAEALRQRLDEDGYIFIRELVPSEHVLAAREAIMSFLDQQAALVPGQPMLEGVMRDGASISMKNRTRITHHDTLRRVYEGPEMFGLYRDLFGEEAVTFDYKWLRAVGNEEFTGCHMDHVYMGRGSNRLLTAWVPFGRIRPEQGTLAICAGSHNLPSFELLRNTYGKLDVNEAKVHGWFTSDPREITSAFGGRWLTADFEPGDILTFGMHTMHASTTNTTHRYRLSCDVRFQPASDPVDERWVGEHMVDRYAAAGHHDNVEGLMDLRRRWGLQPVASG